MKLAPDHICPRCGGDVPNTEYKGQYLGALSRTDDLTEICSDCGTHEALDQALTDRPLKPQHQWVHPPIKVTPTQ
jgi:hypothetical protein